MSMSLVDIIYNLPDSPKTICLRELFGNDRPIELEIGTGKGGFLLQQAQAHEDRNYLGIEWANKYFRLAADRMARWDVGNVRMIRCDAKVFVQRYLPAASICALHVHHPDPWPKRRHHRRRLFDEAFIDAAFEQILTRSASVTEKLVCRNFLKQQIKLYSSIQLKQSTAKRAVQASADLEMRAKESLVHALLNHNDFVTVR